MWKGSNKLVLNTLKSPIYYTLMIMLVVITVVLVVNYTLTAAYSQPLVSRSSVEAIPKAFPFKVVFASNSDELAVKGFQFMKDIKGRDVYYTGIQILVKIENEVSEGVKYRVTVRVVDTGGNVWEFQSNTITTEEGNTINMVYIAFDCSGVTCLTPSEVLEVGIALDYLGPLVLENG